MDDPADDPPIIDARNATCIAWEKRGSSRKNCFSSSQEQSPSIVGLLSETLNHKCIRKEIVLMKPEPKQ